jgi:hypothetical protein
VSEESKLSPGKVLLGAAIGLAIVVGLSIVVGYAGPKPGFQWELASIFGTALGTTLLAASTGALAYSTWSDVRATWQLADLTKHDQDERERPLVLQLDWRPEIGSALEGYLMGMLRNVGLGPALRVEVTADYADEDGNEPSQIDSVVFPAIPSGETQPFQLFVRFSELTNEVRPDGFRLRGTFTDRSQQRNYDIISWQN